MKRQFCALFFAIIIPALAFGYSDESNKKAMNNDLEFIKGVFEVKYAPAEWKKSYCGWDFDKEIEIAKANIAACPQVTLKDYQRELKRVLNSTKDYHVQTMFSSTEYAFLPFGIRSALSTQGAETVRKYYITSLESEAPSGLSLGDEVILFGGVPVREAIEELRISSFDDATPETDQMFAEEFLTSRFGFAGLNVPQGAIIVVVKSKDTQELQNYELNWIYGPEIIESFQETDYALSPSTSQSKLQEAFEDTTNEMVLPSYAMMKKIRKSRMGEDDNTIGGKKSFVPELGRILWKAKDTVPFHAYIFDLDGHRVGYVRIPSYDAGEEEAKFFGALMNKFEKTTDALVIDQVNNPGGYVYYSYGLLSMLAKKPLHVPMHQFALTQDDILRAFKMVSRLEKLKDETDFGDDTMLGYPVTQELVLSLIDHFQFFIDEWKAKKYFSSPCYESGISHIHPHPKTHYTKPILFLVNSLDFSCGDFVPAILQDNKRATIFGTRTAGAGGIVHNFSYPNRFGIEAISLTKSFARRFNNEPLENLGVQPDVVYELTEEDLLNNYSGYKAKVHETLETLIHHKH